jgi:anti-sigma factor RsiW
MTCHQLGKALQAFVAGELPPEQHRRLERHLHGCPLCAAELDDYERVRRLGRQLPRLSPSPEFLERLRAALAAPEGPALPREGEEEP